MLIPLRAGLLLEYGPTLEAHNVDQDRDGLSVTRVREY